MLNSILTPEQLTVISALSTGASTTEAAAEAGIHRNTINNWRRNSLPFQHALADAQYDRALLYREQAEALIPQAFAAINHLADPKPPAGVRLKAALALIDLATTPPEPKKQIELVLSSPSSLPVPAAKPEAPKPVPQQANESAPIAHNFAQQPLRRESPKVGRNESCPCGSGLKFKRCCLNKPLAAAA